MARNHKQSTKRPRVRVAGFSLLEVLVALFVLAIGILGMARLMLASKQANFEAVQRSTAVTLAQDMIERVRANRSQLAAYSDVEVGSGSAAEVACSANCSSAQIAQSDIYQWEQALLGVAEQSAGASVGGLVTPVGCVTVDNNLVTVAIAWRGAQPNTAPANIDCGAGTIEQGQRQVLWLQTYVSS